MKKFAALVIYVTASLILACGGASNNDNGDGDTDGSTDADMDGITDGSHENGDTAGETGEPLPEFEECVAVSETAKNTRGPADIIIVIDNTPSMGDEIEMVRLNMNRFSGMVEAEGLDLRIVLISCLPGDCGIHEEWHGICIDPPVGADGGCPEGGPYSDSNPPDYLHISEPVPSLKGLERTIDAFDQWSAVLRPGMPLHFVYISDDNDEYTATQFNSELLALDPGLEDYTVHAIFAYRSKEDACADSASEPCCTFAAPGGEGAVYRELVTMTGGRSGDLCLQDFAPLFDEFADAVIESAVLSCEWEIPEPPDGETLDPELVNVEFIDGDGEVYPIGHVDSAGLCGSVEHGWYYDDPSSPGMVYVCPQTCEWIQGKPGSRMDILFGCETEEAPLL